MFNLPESLISQDRTVVLGFTIQVFNGVALTIIKIQLDATSKSFNNIYFFNDQLFAFG
jgi:hypothetical protein